jgi:GNAT superfamily N-acetyltransferase
MAIADMNHAIRRITRDEVERCLDHGMRLRLGEMIYHALPEFYERILLERSTLLPLLADQVDVPATELSETYGFWDAGVLLGILSVVNSRDLKRSQTSGTVMIVRELEGEAAAAFKSGVADFGRSVEDLASLAGKYLPRMAVSPEARGKGIARALMNHVLGLYPDDLIALHVAQTNIVVIKLHTSLGFKPQSDTALPIRVLVRPRTGEAASATPKPQ